MSVKVSVLMSCKNSKPELLKAAIDSVLKQTFQDFEFVIVDDGSTIPLEPLIRSISKDEKIKVFRINPSGLGAALTYGINNSQGEYIARLDDDDLMTHNRLERQVAFLDFHKDVVCVGSQRYSYCGNRYVKHRRFPTEHEEILKSMLSLKWAMAHSALMYRRESIIQVGGYRVKGTGEDLDMILQLSLVGKLANIDEYLLYYNLSMGSLSAKESQLYGHQYALFEYQKEKNGDNYCEIIEQSLNYINKKINKGLKVFHLKKRIMLIIISLFGDKLPQTL